MKTDSTYTSAHIQYDSMIQQIQKTIIPKCEHNDIIITQGFIGSDEHDIVTTLGRGGSDFSAALIGMAIEAQEIVIWTDVSGIASADPKLISHAHTIEKMSFQEARLLSFFGAKVLHPETILPAIKHNIPVIVKNTFSPHDKGTTIVSDSSYSESNIISITSKNAVGLVEFTHQTFSITQKMSIIGEFLDTLQCDLYAFGCLENTMYAVISLDRINFLSKAESLKDWEISYKDQSFIAAIGPNKVSDKYPDILSTFNQIICQHNFMPILLSGISEYALCAVINQKSLHQTLISLHTELIE
jgi:aspartate kinase